MNRIRRASAENTAGPRDGGRTIRRARGFTLLEVLVTVLVLSLGLLGIAALQVASIRDTQGAYLKSQAVSRAYQIVDAMRANRESARDGDYADDFDEQAGSYCDIEDPTAVQSDLCAWEQALAASLPDGAGSVQVDSASGIATVCVRWAEPKRAHEIAVDKCSTADDDAEDRQVFELQTVL